MPWKVAIFHIQSATKVYMNHLSEGNYLERGTYIL